MPKLIYFNIDFKEEGTKSKVLNMKANGKHPKGRLRARWEHRLGKMSCIRKGEHDEI
jgi:hypothetical protein